MSDPLGQGMELQGSHSDTNKKSMSNNSSASRKYRAATTKCGAGAAGLSSDTSARLPDKSLYDLPGVRISKTASQNTVPTANRCHISAGRGLYNAPTVAVGGLSWSVGHEAGAPGRLVWTPKRRND